MADAPVEGLAVRVRGLIKSYGEVRALVGVDLEIERGEIFALLGPNGAGKTTTVEILEGYRRRDGGAVRSSRTPAERPDSSRTWASSCSPRESSST